MEALSHFGWPQWTMLALCFLDAGCGILLHGAERSPYNGYAKTLDAIIVGWLLWMGGFFS